MPLLVMLLIQLLLDTRFDSQPGLPMSALSISADMALPLCPPCSLAILALRRVCCSPGGLGGKLLVCLFDWMIVKEESALARPGL